MPYTKNYFFLIDPMSQLCVSGAEIPEAAAAGQEVHFLCLAPNLSLFLQCWGAHHAPLIPPCWQSSADSRDGCQDVPSPPENVSTAAAHGVVRSIFKCLPLRVASSRLSVLGSKNVELEKWT